MVSRRQPEQDRVHPYGFQPPVGTPFGLEATTVEDFFAEHDDTTWLQHTAPLQLLDEHRALGRRPLDTHHALRRSLLESLLLRLANAPAVSGAVPAASGTYGRFLDAPLRTCGT